LTCGLGVIGQNITDNWRMIAVFRPVNVRSNSYVETLWMKTLSGKDVVDVVTPVRMMVKIERLVQLFAVLAAVLAVIQAVNSALMEKRNEITKLVPARRSIKYEVGIKVARPDRLGTRHQVLVHLEGF
jgi:hypothetical protein